MAITKKKCMDLGKEVAREIYGELGRFWLGKTDSWRGYQYVCSVFRSDEVSQDVIHRDLRSVLVYLNGMSAGAHAARYSDRKGR